MKSILALSICLLFSAQSFSQSLLAQAKSVDSDNWGYINTKGEFVIKEQFKNCHAFSEDGYAPIYDKKRKSFYFIDPTGKELATDVKTFKLKNIFGFGTKSFQDKMVGVEVGKNWGYLNTKGALVIPAKYDVANIFSDGFATVRLDKTWMIVDQKGTEIAFAENVVDANHFSEGLAPIRISDNWGFAATDGSVAIKANFKSVGYFNNGLAWAKTEDGKVGFIDTKGNWVIKPKYNAAKDFSNDGLARVKLDSWTFVDKTGKELTVPSADSFGDFSDGLAYIKTGGKVGFMNKKGDVVIDQQFDRVRDFKNGYAAVVQGEKWGFIDTKGEWVIKPQFDGVKDFEKTGSQ